MIGSFIYSELDRTSALRAGYFEPKTEFHLFDEGAVWNPTFLITRKSRLIFFPGSFGTFHEGHVSICQAALKKYPDATLVISPSNSDYAAEKYGAWSEFASNKHRYQAIKRALPNANIDFDPMLNMTCDQNITDLLENFLDAHGLTIEQMMVPPIILVGKDRAGFLHLNKHTNLFVVEHYDDTTGQSTSLLKSTQREKKHLYLRCQMPAEFGLFREAFADQYTSITPIYLNKELEAAKFSAAVHGCTHTICKEYKSFLPYIKLSRTFENPLDDATFPMDYGQGITPAMKIFDSDVYSGATRRFIQRQGAGFVALIDMESSQDSHELLDISDFRKTEFAYPWVDISSRCSMQAFDHNFHKRFNAFRKELQNV